MALLQRFTLPQGASAGRVRRPLAVCASSNSDRSRSSHGRQFDANNKQRRRGRPAWMRSPYDSPLRDGNRDRLIGLLTERAAKTLMVYLMETNANVYSWLVNFYKENPIPKSGSWDEVSGEAFLRKLLSMPIEEAKYNTGRDSLFDNVQGIGVDPRSIAQRIMDIRTQLSEEFVQELKAIAEENSILLRETLQTSLSSTLQLPDIKSSSDNSSSADASSNSSRSSPAGTRPPSPERKPDVAAYRPSFRTPTPAAWRRNKPADGSRPGSPSSVKGSSGTYSLSSLDNQPASSADPKNAAAVAALNAALNASLPTDVAASHPELTGGSVDGGVDGGAAAAGASADEGGETPASAAVDQVDVRDAIAQLQQSLDADVAKLIDWDGVSLPAAELVKDNSVPADSAPPKKAQTGLSSEEAPAVDAQQAAAVLQVPAEQPPAAADVGAVEAAVSISAGSLPKGWGPRLGVGFSNIRNNIVSIAKIKSKMTPAVDATGVSVTQQQ